MIGSWAILNPGKKRRGRGRAKGKRRVSAKTRRKLSRAARRRSSRKSYRAGLIEGGKRCGMAFRSMRQRERDKRALPSAYRSNPLWMPSYGYNPGSSVIGNVKKAYSVPTLKDAAMVVGGAVANGFVSGFVAGLPVIPDAVRSGYGKAGLQLATAGLTGALTKMIAPKYTNPIVLGGVVSAVVTGLKASPFAGSMGLAGMGCNNDGMMGMRGMDDWLRNTQPIISAPVPNPQLGHLMDSQIQSQPQDEIVGSSEFN